MEAYKTIQGTAQARIEEKKSEFIAHAAFADTEEKALAFLNGIRAKHRTANHNVANGDSVIRSISSVRSRTVISQPPFPHSVPHMLSAAAVFHGSKNSASYTLYDKGSGFPLKF